MQRTLMDGTTEGWAAWHNSAFGQASSGWRWFANQAADDPKAIYGGRISPFHSWSLKPQRHNWCAGYAAPKPQLVPSFQTVISSQMTTTSHSYYRNIFHDLRHSYMQLSHKWLKYRPRKFRSSPCNKPWIWCRRWWRNDCTLGLGWLSLRLSEVSDHALPEAQQHRRRLFDR